MAIPRRIILYGCAALFVCMVWVGNSSGESYYSNSNRSLFALPSFTGAASSGLSFNTDATPNSNPANCALDSVRRLSIAYTGFYDNAFGTSVASLVDHSLARVSVGISLGYLSIPDIEITDHFIVNPKTGEVIFENPLYKTSSEIFCNFIVAALLYDRNDIRVAGGVSLHGQRRRLIDWTGYGIGADLGVSAEFTRVNANASLLLEDVTTNYIHWSSHYHDVGLPHLRLGLGWRRVIPYLYGELKIMYKSPDLFSNEGVISSVWGDSIPSIKKVRKHPSLLYTAAAYGAEFEISRTVIVRAGLDESQRIFFGAGVDVDLLLQRLSVDFAYMVPYTLPGTYSVCLGYRW